MGSGEVGRGQLRRQLLGRARRRGVRVSRSSAFESTCVRSAKRDRQRAALLDQQDRDAAGRGSRPSVSNSVSTTVGARPSEGSSSSSTSGRAISARAIASCCCWPPESAPAWRAANSATTGKSERDPRDGRRRRPPSCGARRARAAGSPRPSASRRCGGPRGRARRRRARCPRARPAQRRAVQADRRRARPATTPMIACSVVDLPAPLGPIRPTISPRPTSRLRPRTAGTAP